MGRRDRSPKQPPSGSPELRGDRDRISAVERLLRVHRGRNAAGSLLKLLRHVKGIRAPSAGAPRGGFVAASWRSAVGVARLARRFSGLKARKARDAELVRHGRAKPGRGWSNRNPAADGSAGLARELDPARRGGAPAPGAGDVGVSRGLIRSGEPPVGSLPIRPEEVMRRRPAPTGSKGPHR